MSRLLKFIGAQFGITGNEDQEDTEPPAYVDPEARRLADAEINGSLVIAERREKLVQDAQVASHKAMGGGRVGNPVDIDGNVDFELFFSQANVHREDFTADQAIKVIENVEKTIPAIISDIQQRNSLLRNV
jgi:hypothetical protein